MIEILNVDNASYSDKNGEYGGASGLKDGLIINDKRYLVKYPKNAAYLSRHEEMSYTNDPVSEYLGSQIYAALGYNVHETMLVERRGKIAVACKDFLQNNERLVEIRTLKNAANDKLAEELERDFSNTNSSHVVNFEEILLHIQHNELLKIPGLEKQFFNMIVVDAFINNSDRNNGNWGIIRCTDKPDRVAPVFDNGGAFNGKTPDSRLQKMLEQNSIKGSVLNSISVFGKDDTNFLVRNLLKFNITNLQCAIVKNFRLIENNIDNIHKLIDDVPDIACSPIRKKFYHQSLDARIKYLLRPAYDLALESLKEKYPAIAKDFFNLNDIETGIKGSDNEHDLKQ